MYVRFIQWSTAPVPCTCPRLPHGCRPDGSAPEKPHEGEEEGEQNAFLLHLIGMGMGLCTLVVYACIKVGAESEAADYAG